MISLATAALRALRLQRPRLIGALDTPAPRAIADRKLIVTGWALARGSPPEAVLVRIDGEVRAVTAVGVARPDVAQVHPEIPGSARSGFRTTVPLDGIGPGRVTICLDVVRSDGRVEALDRTWIEILTAVSADQVMGEIEAPLDDGAVDAAEPVWVWGWALGTASQVSRVDVLVDGESVGPARMGIDRPEIADRTGLTEGLIAGFAKLIDPVELAPGRDRLRIGAVVHHDGGTERLPEVTVALRHREAQPARRAPRASRSQSPAIVMGENGRPPSAPGARRLIVFTHSLELGGAQLYLLELLRAMRSAAEIEATVVAPGDGPLRLDLEAEGIEVHLVPAYAVNGAEAYEHQQEHLLAWASTRVFDCALVNTIIAFPGADVACRLGIPVVWAIHESYALREFWASGYPSGYVPDHVRSRALDLLGQVDALVFEAEATRRQYLPVGRPERMVTVPYGIDLAAIERYRARTDRGSARRALGVSRDARLVLCLGTIEPRKCQTVLARAFGRLAPRHPDALLALVGAPTDDESSYETALRAYVREIGLSGRVLIEPISHDPYTWIAASDLLVCASDLESLPRVVLEAMAFEVPVAATSIFGIPEVIDDGVSGLLFGVGDKAAMVAALECALSMDPAALREIGRAGATTIRSHHDVRAYALRALTLFDALVDEPDRSPGEALR